MKKLVLIVLLLAAYIVTSAQFGGVLNKIKKKAEEKVDKKTEIGTNNSTGNKNTGTVQNNSPQGSVTEPPQQNASQEDPVSIKAYSKYDFVPGEKVIGFEDFSTGSIGDFPAGWNTNGSAEIVTIEGKSGRWLFITKPGVFVPEFTDSLSNDFTFEFDLMHGTPFSGGNSVVLYLSLTQLQNTDQPQNWGVANNRYTLTFLPANTGGTIGWISSERRKNGTGEASTTNEAKYLTDQFNPAHISIWRQKERVRVYINEEKVWDVPKAISIDAELNSLIFFLKYAEPTSQYYLGNLRMAIGAPDTRNKFLTESKWVTHGILFDVNSATIKPESYGSLKEMANVLKENADLKVKIVGHTDADGKDDANLDLSKRRAASVKVALIKEFGLDETRMETDGKGEAEPIDKNDTPAGKANNRRVEFLKI